MSFLIRPRSPEGEPNRSTIPEDMNMLVRSSELSPERQASIEQAMHMGEDAIIGAFFVAKHADQRTPYETAVAQLVDMGEHVAINSSYKELYSPSPDSTDSPQELESSR